MAGRFWIPLLAWLVAGALDTRPARAEDGAPAPLASVAPSVTASEPTSPPQPAAPGELARPTASADGPSTSATTFLAEIGRRERDLPHQRFAVSLIARLGLTLDPDVVAAPDGPALLSAARARDACDRRPSALAGDLVVFGEGWLVGVVAGTRPNGAVEIVYVYAGVVRRGAVSPDRPGERRDAEGRALNTFVRPYDKADPPGQAHLAGELFTCFLRLDDLLARGSATSQ